MNGWRSHCRGLNFTQVNVEVEVLEEEDVEEAVVERVHSVVIKAEGDTIDFGAKRDRG